MSNNQNSTSLSTSTNNSSKLNNSGGNSNNSSPISNSSSTSSNSINGSGSGNKLTSSISPKSIMSSSGNIPIPQPGSIPTSITLSDDSEHITISYQDDTGVWNFVEPELINHLPLRNIAWKTKTGHTKVVEKMPIEILHHDDERIKSHQTQLHTTSAQHTSHSNNNTSPLQQHQQQVQELYKKPYLYLYFIHCDDGEVYKNQIKPKIKTWVTTMTERQQEWLIVYVSLGTKRFSELTSKLNISRTVYDKIKNDFNVKRDRCCQLRFFDDNNKHEDLWEDFLGKMKEGIISSAEQYLTAYEEEIRKLDAKRILPGWSYLNFFYVKESLAFIYERAQLYEDALMQYFELEVLFTDNKSQFEQISSPNQSEEIQPILDTTKKPYRELIQSGKISLFDFKHYLFARQTKLLFLLQKPMEVATRTLIFLTSVSVIIKKNTPKYFQPYFREAWAFTVSMEMIKECRDSYEKVISSNQTNLSSLSSTQKNTKSNLSKILGVLGNGFSNNNSSNNNNKATINSISIPGLSGSQSLTQLQSNQLSAAMNTPGARLSLNQIELESKIDRQDKEALDFLLGDLLFNAAQRLDELAIHLKFIAPNIDTNENQQDNNNVINFEEILNSTLVDDQDSPNIPLSSVFNYKFLYDCFKSKSNYQSIFLDILSQTEKYYTGSNRFRSMLRLQYTTGNFYFRQKVFETAETILKNIQIREPGWNEVEYSIKTKLAYCQKHLSNIQDYITTCVGLLVPGILKNQQEKLYYLNELYQISQLDGLNLIQPMSPLFKSLDISSEPILKYLDQANITVNIKNYLSTSVKISKVIVSYIKSTHNPLNEKLNFTLSDIELKPGHNKLELQTTVTTSKSTFIRDSVCLMINNLTFNHSLRDINVQNQTEKTDIKVVDSDSLTKCIAFTTHPQFLQMVQYIGVKLFTNSDQLEMGHLSFHPVTDITIIPTLSFNVIYTNSEGVSRIVETPLKEFKLPIYEMKSNEAMEFYLPVLAVNKEPCNHQISIELNHQKQTKEKFSSSLVTTSLFINPFSIVSNFISVNNKNNNSSKYFLKLNIECTSKTMLQLNTYHLVNCDLEFTKDSKNSFYLLNDFNQPILNTFIHPGQNLILIFEINRYESNNKGEDMSFQLKYTNPSQDSPLVRECKPLLKENQEYTCIIPYETSKHLYRVDARIQDLAHVGDIIPLEFTITNLNSGTNNLQYSFELDHSMWMVSGKSKHSFTLEDGKSQTFKCNLIPITTGSLPIPPVILQGINSQNIDNSKNRNQSVCVYPTSLMFTCQSTDA